MESWSTESNAHEKIGFREMRLEDIGECSRLAYDAWASDPEEPEQDVDPMVMEGYVRSFLARSNRNEVAFDSHGLVGLLFGRLAGAGGRGQLRASLAELGMIPQFMFNRHASGMSPVVLWHFFMTEFKVFVNVPRADAEINLLIVDARNRGRGLGRALVDRFMARARAAGCRLVTLYTDDQMSNWRFYEILGFKKVATFDDGLTSYFSERAAKGIVYVLDLGTEPGHAERLD